MTYTITIPIEPVAKARPRVVNGHAFTPRKTLEYERRIAHATKDIHLDGAVSLDIEFTMPMPKSWSKKKKARMLGAPHESRPDIDNLAKAVMDGMFTDDSKVYDIRARKIYGEVGKVMLSVSTDKYCKDCKYFTANHCFHEDFYPIESNRRLYGDDRYTHEYVCACALFEEKGEHDGTDRTASSTD